LDRSLLPAATATIATPTALAVAIGRVLLLLRGRSGLRLLLLLLTARQVRARAIAHRDQERRDVLAVLVGLLKGGAGAVGRYALATESDRDFIRLGIRAFDPTLSVGLVQAHVVDDLALLVVETSKKGARPEQAPQAAVRKGRKCVCE
jgi:hypothetical protein